MTLQKGKRYWFKNRDYIYSGLYAEDDEYNDNVILIRKNGMRWNISKDNIFKTILDATNGLNPKYFKIIDN